MKRLIADDDGRLKAYWVRDSDEDVRFGIPDNPPDLTKLDWIAIEMELSNLLVKENLITYQDVQRRQQEFTAIILAVVRNPIVNLYKLQATEVSNGKRNRTG